MKDYSKLDGIMRQLNECIISAYDKGYEQCFKDMTDGALEGIRKSTLNNLQHTIQEMEEENNGSISN